MDSESGFAGEVLRINERFLVEVVEALGLCPWAEGARKTGALKREVILDAIFQKSREELVIAAAAPSERAARELAWRALRAHDYVFDVFAPDGEPAASATRHVAPYDRQ